MTNCIVYIPGLWGGSDPDIQVYIPSEMRKSGVEFYVLDAPNDTEITDAAKKLAADLKYINIMTSGIHLVGHSMGGLIGRYYLSHLWKAPIKIRSFTTLATPHQGSPFAQDGFKFLDRAIDDLSYEGVKKFNTVGSPEYSPEHPKIPNYSYGAKIPGFWSALKKGTLWELYLNWQLSKILKKQGVSPDNDSVVPTFSQSWGTYLGTLEVSHRYFALKTGYKSPDVIEFLCKHFEFLEGMNNETL